MHIPDGMLETRTWATAWVASAGIIGWASRWVRRRMDDARIVLMAVMAALVFALQMLNFPVAGGTSGHFAGGAALAIVLGPWPAVVVMTTVLTIQAFVFADGGIAALGANVLNMGILAPFAGWAVYTLFARVNRSRTSRIAGAFVAGWLAAVVAALAVAVEVWASGRAPLAVVAVSMGLWHALIGVGEGAITAGLVAYLLSVRPDLLFAEESAAKPLSRRATVTLAGAAVAAAMLSFLASTNPDGLERVAEALGLMPAGEGSRALAPGVIPDYVVPGVANSTLAGVLAGLVGLVLTGFAALALARALRTRTNRAEQR